METRPSLYYPGNTVIAPHPGRKRKEKVTDPEKLPEFEGKNMDDNSHKVCAVSRCVWCGYQTDQYFINCPHCNNCQYCGMVDMRDPYRCYLCGNYLPEDERTHVKKILPEQANKVTEKVRGKGYNKPGSNATIGK